MTNSRTSYEGLLLALVMRNKGVVVPSLDEAGGGRTL